MLAKNITKNQSKDTGLAFLLILLLFITIGGYTMLYIPAIIILLITMIYPSFFYQPARLWFGLSHLIGGVISRILLSIIFFLLVTSLGLIRRAMGADPMKEKLWKSGQETVFSKRDHSYSKSDLENPY